MHKIKIFLTLLIVHCTLLIGTASAQWWVQGGNFLWPYGKVEITKGPFRYGKMILLYLMNLVPPCLKSRI